MCPVPVVSTTSPRATVEARLREAAPEVRSPAGEAIVVDEVWACDVAHDPQRLALLPAALTALEQAQEVWAFRNAADPSQIEHRPHLLWCRLDEATRIELIVAGTRRIGSKLHLHTWFRMAEPHEALARYLRRGHRVFPPLALQAAYRERTDILYLHPSPHVSYRAVRLTPDVPIYGYLGDALGYPSLAGFEIQDAREHGRRLAEDPDLVPLTATICELGGKRATLGAHLAGLLGAGDPS